MFEGYIYIESIEMIDESLRSIVPDQSYDTLRQYIRFIHNIHSVIVDRDLLLNWTHRLR
jgi:hypothetical protein